MYEAAEHTPEISQSYLRWVDTHTHTHSISVNQLVFIRLPVSIKVSGSTTDMKHCVLVKQASNS